MEGGSEDISLPGTEIRWNEAESLLTEGSLHPDFSETLILENRFSVEEQEQEYGEEGDYEPEE